MSNHTTNRSRWHVQRLHKVQQQQSAPSAQQQQQHLEKYDDDDDDNDDDDDTLPGAYAISRNTLECRGGPCALSSFSLRDDFTTTIIPYNDPLSSQSYPTAATTTMTNPVEAVVVQFHPDDHEQPQQKCISKRRLCISLSVTIISFIAVAISITIVTMRNKSSSSDRKDACIFDRKTIAQCHSKFLEIPDCAREMFLSLLEENREQWLGGGLSTNQSNYQLFPCDAQHYSLLAVAVVNVNAKNENNNNSGSIIDMRQYLTLATIYFSMGGQGWKQDRNWLTGASSCNGDWYGISCSTDKIVEAIQLGGNNLTGTFPSEIASLSALKQINFVGGNIAGTIPSEIGTMQYLAELKLQNTELSGTIPTEIGLCQSLKFLDLIGVELSGSIPSEIGQLTTLESLGLSGGGLSGTLPSELGFLTRLSILYLTEMINLRGTLPIQFSQMSSLTEIYVSDSFHDDILLSSFLSSLPTSLVMLTISSGGFMGSIPNEIYKFRNLTHLTWMELHLTGTLPSEFGLLTQLQTLDLSALPNVRGSIPSEIGRLTRMTYLNLEYSSFETSLPSEVMSLTGLEIIQSNP